MFFFLELRGDPLLHSYVLLIERAQDQLGSHSSSGQKVRGLEPGQMLDLFTFPRLSRRLLSPDDDAGLATRLLFLNPNVELKKSL